MGRRTKMMLIKRDLLDMKGEMTQSPIILKMAEDKGARILKGLRIQARGMGLMMRPKRLGDRHALPSCGR
jgi:hypothetical protein